jgi:uncharacterized protein (DUF58 family)
VAHGLRVIRSALVWAGAPRGATRLGVGLRALGAHARRRSALILLSDFRDPDWPAASGELAAELAVLARRNDLIAAPLLDPAEEELPRVGPLRIADPERPGAVRVVHTSRKRVRQRYRTAARVRRRRLESELRRCGAEVLWLRTDRSPLHALGHFLRERAARRVAV